jgi:predicted amidohydrolase
MNLSISLAQMKTVHGDFRRNTSHAMSIITRASDRGSDMVVFPELWTAGFDYSDCHSYALANCHYLEKLQEIADSTGIAIGGSYLVEMHQKFFNQFVLLQPGLPRLTYEKNHLFHMMEEDAHLSPGEWVAVFSTRWGFLCLAVCYDLRFPEMFRIAREAGSDLMILSAGWPLKRIEHWNILLRARAIENQCFLAAANCVGGDEKLPFGGCSAVIDPWGKDIAAGGDQDEELVSAVIDLEEVSRVRAQYPFYKDRLERYALKPNSGNLHTAEPLPEE